jgi:aminoglycoside phosphotransferase (APT) family kinase protein
MSGTPLAEVDVDERVVRAVLAEQHADLAALPIRLMDAGWDNFMFRLGDACTVRMPRRQAAVALLIHEQTWLPVLAPHLPIAVPAPLRIGRPSKAYPWPWSILPWLNGAPANQAPPASDQASRLAACLKALHQLAPTTAPVNTVRGCPLADRAEGVAARLDQLKRTTPDLFAGIERAWDTALSVPSATEARWIHGDLHARNVLVDHGTISAIIDWGDITSGDVATDLAGIWALFEDADARLTALNAYGATAPEIARAMGWAINFGTILLTTGLVDNPRHAAMGADTLRRVAHDVAVAG